MVMTDKEYKERYHGESRLVPCKRCGKLLVYNKWQASYPTYCNYCKKQVNEERQRDDPRTKSQKRFDKAIEELKEQVNNFDEYKRPIELAKTRMYSYGSIPEVLVAIELLRLGYKVIPQQRILNYHVDFCLPDEKIVIEVDGKMYHGKPTGREGKIQLALGFDWKIINIPAELIRKDIRKLQECIKL